MVDPRGDGLAVDIGIVVESSDTPIDGIECGQQQDRCRSFGDAKLSQDFQTAGMGQHDIEHDRILLIRFRSPHSVTSVGGRIDCETVFAERPYNAATNRFTVFDD